MLRVVLVQEPSPSNTTAHVAFKAVLLHIASSSVMIKSLAQSHSGTKWPWPGF